MTLARIQNRGRLGARMAAEMAEAPGAVRRLLEERHSLVEALRPVPRTLAGVVLLGRGSSEHAALYGRYLLEIATGRPASLFPPSLAATTGTAGTYRGHLAVAVSQSGETADVVAALRTLSGAGALTVALTARPDSPLGTSADIVVDLRTGMEEAVPATKTFVASLAALALIGEVLGVVPWSPVGWEQLIKGLHGLLADPGPVDRAVVRLGPNDTVACVARNLLRPIAGEAALKLQEAALLQADAHSSISFHHGPVAAVGPDRPVIGFASAGPWGDDTRRLLHRVRLYGSQTILVDQSAEADVPLPPAVPAGLLPLAAAVVAEQIALACAVQRGLDPDQPPGLTKVTRP
jgi:glutamine---fructose-6-phosphate transaminase (isomerizing)